MKNEKIKFAYNEKDYVFWIWKGDYLNVGAGAEIGLYTKDSEFNTGKLDQYFAKTSLAMPMELYLYNYESSDNINNIISWKPEEKQWWITGFNPNYVNNVDVSKQVMVGKIDFTGREDMYNAFKNTLLVDKVRTNIVFFDDESKNAWICW